MENGEDCCVKVAVQIRPLIPDEKLQGCKDCVSVPPGQPQVLPLFPLLLFLFSSFRSCLRKSLFLDGILFNNLGKKKEG
jgi:hypothetical protein